MNPLQTINYNQFQFHDDIRKLTDEIANDPFWAPDRIVALGRGGLIPGTCLSHRLAIPMFALNWAARDYATRGPGLADITGHILANDKILFVDDMVDSGRALADLFTELESWVSQEGEFYTDNCRVAVLYNNIDVDALFENEKGVIKANYYARLISRVKDPRWIHFWWEETGKE